MNITKLTEKYINEHPYIRHSLRKGILNYSSLARNIASEENLSMKDNFDAILIACRRYRDKVKADTNEAETMDMLRKSRIEVKNKIMIMVLEKNIYRPHIELIEKKVRHEKDVFRLVESASAVTLITGEDYSREIRNIFKDAVIKENKGLVEVTLKTSKDIEDIPGVMAFLYSLFAEHNINIVETMSCWTDTIFIIDEKYLSKVMEILRF